MAEIKDEDIRVDTYKNSSTVCDEVFIKRKIVSTIEVSRILEYISQKDPEFDLCYIESGVRSHEEIKKIVIKGNYVHFAHGRKSFKIYEISFIEYETGKVFIKDIVIKNSNEEGGPLFDNRYWEKKNV